MEKLLSSSASSPKTENELYPNYVMTYNLNEKKEWSPKGMGSVTFVDGIVKCVSIEKEKGMK